MARKSLSKKARFEVFKRDKFQCQYCGESAPDVVLHVDHIRPVAEGGDNEMMNLVTSCAGCNLGKGAKRLDDHSEVQKQRDQIAELEQRRQQLEMMMEWRSGLHDIEDDALSRLSDYIGERWFYVPNESGKADLRKWIKRFSFQEILEAAESAFTEIAEVQGERVTKESWERAFKKVPAFANVRRRQKDKPYLGELFYIRGIVRNRVRWRQYDCMAITESAFLAGVPLDAIADLARNIDSVDEFEGGLDDLKAVAEGEA